MTSKKEMEKELTEMLGIYRAQIYNYTMVQESFPRVIAEIERDMAKLTLRKADLTNRVSCADAEIASYHRKIEEANAMIVELHKAPIKSRSESRVSKFLRLSRELAAIEAELAKDIRDAEPSE